MGELVPSVAIESFRPYYNEIMTWAKDRFVKSPNMDSWGVKGRNIFPSLLFDRESFLAWSKLTLTEYQTLMRAMNKGGGRETVNFKVVDKLFTAYGIPFEIHNLYLVREGRSGGECWQPIAA